MLKVLLLQKQLEEKRTALKELEKREAAFATREEELKKDIAEAKTPDEQKVVEDAVNVFEADKADVQSQKKALAEDADDLERQIAELEEKKRSTEKKQERTPEQRKDEPVMESRKRYFGMTRAEMDNFAKRADVNEFLEGVRAFAHEKRSVTGAELAIPEVVLGVIRENITDYSKLLKHVNLKTVRGNSRLLVMGTVPEAVWTEAVGKINEINFAFTQVEIDGYKVAGYVAIPISTVEDSDIDLVYDLMVGLSQAIGVAIDKAILYGTGTKMPLGIVTRLAQTTRPEDYPANTRPWADLHTSNIQKFDSSAMTGTEFFAKVTAVSAAAKSLYSVRQEPFWAMSNATYAQIMGFAVATTAAGAYVSSVDKQMPIIRGAIETLDFIPDGDVIGGYGDLYILAERSGASLRQYDQTLAIEDQLLLIGRARYDGKPAIAEGFVSFNINNKDVTTTMTFATDTANTAAG